MDKPEREPKSSSLMPLILALNTVSPFIIFTVTGHVKIMSKLH